MSRTLGLFEPLRRAYGMQCYAAKCLNPSSVRTRAIVHALRINDDTRGWLRGDWGARMERFGAVRPGQRPRSSMAVVPVAWFPPDDKQRIPALLARSHQETVLFGTLPECGSSTPRSPPYEKRRYARRALIEKRRWSSNFSFFFFPPPRTNKRTTRVSASRK